MVPDLSTQFFRPGEPFDFEGYQAALRVAERERAEGVLSPLGALPPRLNLEHYKAEAKERQKRRRESDSSSMLTRVQDELAREHGFPNWRKFSEAIQQRNLRAQRFEKALSARDDRAVLAALELDPGAVVDIALKASGSELTYLGNAGRYRSEPATRTLHVVLFALAKFGAQSNLAEQLGAIVLPDFDWGAAMTVLRDRQREAESEPRSAKDVELLDEALSALAVYDEPEHDVELSED